MSKRYLYALILFFFLSILFIPGEIWAAHDTVTHANNITIAPPARGLSFTLDSTSELESYTINNDTVSFVVSSGSLFKLSYAGKMKFMTDSARGCTETNVECDASTSYVSLTCTTVTDTQTIVVSALTCGGGGSSGGGGGSPIVLADTTPPTGTSVSINNNAVSTASVTVTLSLSANDSSAPIQMMISNGSAFTGANWETYSTTKSWTLTTGNGTKTVYVKFKDSAGNTSSVVSDTITLTSTATITPTETPTPATTPPATTPSVIPSTTLQPVSTVGAEVTVTAPESAVQVVDVAKVSLQPNENLKFSYKYQNESAKKAYIKVVRQLLNSKGKVVKTVTATRTIKPGASFDGIINEALPKSLPAGEYTVKVKITEGKKVEENGFKIQVEKLKQRYFVLGEPVSVDGDMLFDSAYLSKIKSDVRLPVNLKVKYSYTNTDSVKHVVRMVRELLDSNGKVVKSYKGRWTMNAGEKDSALFTQAIASNLSAGDYQIRIRAYDWTTNDLLAENALGFSVELW